MPFSKISALIVLVLLLFGAVGIAALLKGKKESFALSSVDARVPVEIQLEREIRAFPPSTSSQVAAQMQLQSQLQESSFFSEAKIAERRLQNLPQANRIQELFNKDDPKLPIVETIVYKSHVAWQKGRPAWLSDYANHYATSRHFIARSLNEKADYFKQDLAEGDRFNVFCQNKTINFYLLIDLSRCMMWFYSLDLDSKERVLLKSYPVGLGRIDSSKSSGLLTPLGKYTLGDKIIIYKPKMMGDYNRERVEMIRVFGSRWIPFEKEVSGCSAPAKGFGIHGIPWSENEKGELVQDCSSLGKYQSDGCVRLSSEDIEELFAIIITKPTTVELVRDFYDAALPGVERK